MLEKDIRQMDYFLDQKRLVLSNCGKIDPESIEDYLAKGGYQALEKALFHLSQDEVITTVEESGLRGRGGAGFPTGRKWRAGYQATGHPKYIICNGDEGDPGAFMDRAILEGDPHAVIEAMIIAGYAIGASEGFIYVRAEYPLAVKRLSMAIDQANEKGLLGHRILGGDFSFQIALRLGAGAFVCGEAKALIASIEGKRGMPTPKPPRTIESGLFGQPTVLNNVETFANIPQIISNGASWYRQFGTQGSPGTKVFALGGKINRTGLAEVEMGTSLQKLIFDIGGGIPKGKELKAVQTGGPSGGCIPAHGISLEIDYEKLTAMGAMMGSGGMIVMDEDDCMVDIARFFLEFTVEESCGKCTPCRDGTKKMLAYLDKIVRGEGTMADLSALESLGQVIKDASLCGLGKTAPNPVLSTMKHFRHEYLAHIEDKTCPAGVCTALFHYHIGSACIGCGLCARKCPVQAISGQIKSKHAIDLEKCITCGVCYELCPTQAITKEENHEG